MEREIRTASQRFTLKNSWFPLSHSKGAVRHDIPLLHLPEHRLPLHPANHGQGCDLCIQKELRKGEIPSCFFNLVIRPGETVEDCTIQAFARRVLNREAEKDASDE